MSGYSGVREFRPADDADFDDVVARFMDGSASSVQGAIKPGTAGGAYSPSALSASVTGTVITMVRRDVTSFSFMPDGAGRTDYDGTVSWQLWGCAP